MAQILALPPVARVGFRRSRADRWEDFSESTPRGLRLGANAELRIGFHPLALEAKVNNYLCPTLIAHVDWSASGGYRSPRFETRGYRSPHPHVGESGTCCYGYAEHPLRQSLFNGDHLAATMLLAGWLRRYTPGDTLASVRGLRKANNLKPGFQLELQPFGW